LDITLEIKMLHYYYNSKIPYLQILLHTIN